MDKKLIGWAALNALATALYVVIIAWAIFNIGRVLTGPDNFLMPVAMLLLFVISAAVTGSLVLGKPIILYFDDRRKEAVTLFVYTILSLALILAGIFGVLLLTAGFN